MNCYEELLQYSRLGNISSLQISFTSASFSQKEIDNGFRECIKHFKPQNESFVKCIKLYMNKIEDINYRNDSENNTTIIMYCFTEGQETPSELIISCLLQDIDVNITDNDQETCLFKLLQSNKFNEQTQTEFLSSLLTNKVDLNYTNKTGDTLLSLASKLNKTIIIDLINSFKVTSKFDVKEYIELYTEERYGEAIDKLKSFQEKENSIVYNPSFDFNLLMMNFKKEYGSANDNKVVIKNNHPELINAHLLTITTDMSSNLINEYMHKMYSLLKGVNVRNTIDPILLLNKVIMLYLMNAYEQFEQLIKEIETNEDLSQNKFLYFYMRIIKINYLLESRQFIQAKKVYDELVNDIQCKEFSFGDCNTMFFTKNDIVSCLKSQEVNDVFMLYKAYIESFTRNIPDRLKKMNKDNAYPQNRLLKQFRLFINIKLQYHFNTSVNVINHKLDKLLNKNPNEMVQLYYYNTNGIIYLKGENYSLASFFFLKAISIIKQKSPMQLYKHNHYYPQIAYNLSLAYFYLKDYEKCFNLLSYLNKTYKSLFSNNHYLFYRMGLSQMEISLASLQVHSIKNDSYDSYSNECFKLNTVTPKRLPNEIISNFKYCLRLLKKSDEIFFNCFFNLIFCLIFNHEFTEAIFHLHHLLKSKKEELTAQHHDIIQMYLLECYLNLNLVDKAKKLSEMIIMSSFPCTVYEHINGNLLSNEDFKLCYYLNMIKLNVLGHSRDDIEKHLIPILNSINLNISVTSNGINRCEEIPGYLINVFVYYYCFINRIDLALNILKTRKIKHIFLPKGGE